ncbi:hypothetical protein WDW37_19300 [Bdellovibrionota bacterium FG-1]
MKTASAVFGTLAIASTLFANFAMADTSTTSVSATAPRLVDKITASYWGSYCGPSIVSPTARTNDSGNNGELTDIQSLDSTLTLGYKLAPNVTVAGNYRFIFRPMLSDDVPSVKDHYSLKDPWLSLKHSKLLNGYGFNLSTDLRLYIPVSAGTMGKMNTGIRSTQIATYDIPSTRLTLGTYTIARYNSLHGESADLGIADLNLSFSPFANYQITNTVAATFWSDILQYDVTFGQTLANNPMDVALGVNWDISPNISVNPQFTFFPNHATLDATTIGAIISAKFL